MKKITTILALVVFVMGFVVAKTNVKSDEILTTQSTQKDTAIIEFSKTSHDFGDIVVGTQAKTTFEYTNKGTVPLVLSNVQTSCGCTASNWSREPLAPGESAKIDINFNSSGKAGQNINKSITVSSNAATVKLYIRGKVLAKAAEPTSPVRITN